jgi:dihydroorotate dehydrogenase
MTSINYFYSASVMGYGTGRCWHKYYQFPKFSRVTKTITLESRLGIPFAVIKYGNSVWNKVGLHNVGFYKFFSMIDNSDTQNIIVSLAGKDHEIEFMIGILNQSSILFGGVELNFSCPNVEDQKNRNIPKSKYPIYLKLNYLQDPYDYHLENVAGIRLNSVPAYMGGVSGKAAQKHNWKFIDRYGRDGLNIAGCSFTNRDDIKRLEDMGCTEMGIGSVILTDPKFVEKLEEEGC